MRIGNYTKLTRQTTGLVKNVVSLPTKSTDETGPLRLWHQAAAKGFASSTTARDSQTALPRDERKILPSMATVKTAHHRSTNTTSNLFKRDGWRTHRDLISHRNAVTCAQPNPNIVEQRQPVERKVKISQNDDSDEYDSNHVNSQEALPQQELPMRRVDTFSSDDLVVIECPENELKPKLGSDKLVFGHTFTDHMFRVDWDAEQGWWQPLISKLHNIEVHPGAKVLHYALTAFEGAKAYRGHDNRVRFFRLDENVKRLLESTRRLSLPEFDPNELIKCIHKLVQLDQSWIPQAQGPNHLTSLYIRPTIMGVEPSLGVAGSKKALLYVLLSPAGPYFKTGFKPISLYADPKIVRAWPGGAGNTKLGSNYAPTIAAQREAERLNLQQVLWLFGDDMKLTEVGTMNIFVAIKYKDSDRVHLVTPPLTDGLILPGITRKSILELARHWDDVVVEERYVTIGELKQLLQEGQILEMFGAGTACIVCPISSIQMRDGTRLEIPFMDITKPQEGDTKSLTKRILKSITDIQYGRVKHPWAQELIYA